jgi:hypothetical protein
MGGELGRSGLLSKGLTHLVIELRVLVVVENGRTGTGGDECLPWLSVNTLKHTHIHY